VAIRYSVEVQVSQRNALSLTIATPELPRCSCPSLLVTSSSGGTLPPSRIVLYRGLANILTPTRLQHIVEEVCWVIIGKRYSFRTACI
jgi:hypothetical protein